MCKKNMKLRAERQMPYPIQYAPISGKQPTYLTKVWKYQLSEGTGGLLVHWNEGNVKRDAIEDRI